MTCLCSCVCLQISHSSDISSIPNDLVTSVSFNERVSIICIIVLYYLCKIRFVLYKSFMKVSVSIANIVKNV